MDTFAESISEHLNESSRRQDEMKTFGECFKCFSESMGEISTKTYAMFVIATPLGICTVRCTLCECLWIWERDMVRYSGLSTLDSLMLVYCFDFV